MKNKIILISPFFYVKDSAGLQYKSNNIGNRSHLSLQKIVQAFMQYQSNKCNMINNCPHQKAVVLIIFRQALMNCNGNCIVWKVEYSYERLLTLYKLQSRKSAVMQHGRFCYLLISISVILIELIECFLWYLNRHCASDKFSSH